MKRGSSILEMMTIPMTYDYLMTTSGRLRNWESGLLVSSSLYLFSINYIGLVGGTAVEAPKIKDGKIVGFNVKYLPNRPFPIDMAGFAINVRYILKWFFVIFFLKLDILGVKENLILIVRKPWKPQKHVFWKEWASREAIWSHLIQTKRWITDLLFHEPGLQQDKEIFVWHTKPKIPIYELKKVATFGKIIPMAKK